MCLDGNQCIPKSFHCDGETDCQDSSDEIGCTPPIIIVSPPPKVVVDLDFTFIINCTAMGIPTPEIVWRLNWGHVPDKCTMTSTPLDGNRAYGELTCPGATEADQGAYSCEAINSKGSCFAGSTGCGQPGQDALVLIDRPQSICPRGKFNSQAKVFEECLDCFCFNVTNECSSTELVTYQAFVTSRVTPFEVRPQTEGGYDFNPTRIGLDVRTEVDQITGSDIVFFNIDDRSPQGSFVYLDLPAAEKGSRLQYYGGYLQYRLKIDQHWRNLPPMPDVILKGNGYILVHTSDLTPEPSTPTDFKVRFWPGQWFKVFQDGNPTLKGAEYDDGEDGVIKEAVSREDLMITLANIENILIRVQYHGESRLRTSLSNIRVDTAVSPNALAPFRPQAIYVEQCQCPRGYDGLSCQQCAPGFGRGQDNRCVSVTDVPCPLGYYGSPSTGVPCQVCPCSQVQGGYITECYLEADFQVTCSCPKGYQGRRCEQCSPGYTRQRDNQCLQVTEITCPPGYYGHPPSGLECRPCPCSRTPEGYTPTCELDINFQVYCQCPSGYSGQLCDQCAAGYVRYAPGTPCVPDLQCNYPVGSVTSRPNPATGRCQCNSNYYGDLCFELIPYVPQCQEDEFSSTEWGKAQCISCFCMGVPYNGGQTPCQPSNLIRDKEVFIFIDDSLRYSLTDLMLEIEINNLSVDRQQRELYYDNMRQLPTEKRFFWRLPAQFLGNKLGSYGGYLSFSLQQNALSTSWFQESHQVIIRGNGIQLMHIANEKKICTVRIINGRSESFCNQGNYKVFIHESNWQREDGQNTDREHLLMALADLSHILIEAVEDAGQVSRVGIREVSLDISSETSSGTQLATSVEQCSCPKGYKGLSCEDCSPGFTRSSQGFYLGLCKPCECNGHASSCHPETGVCVDCRHHTTGDYCQTCAPGYVGDALEGNPDSCKQQTGFPEYDQCNCNYAGSLSQDCDSRGVCPCKENVVGNNCDQCKSGYFGLMAANDLGCSRCWCSGVTEKCSIASMYWSTLRMPIVDSKHGIKLATQTGVEYAKEDNIRFEELSFEVSYSFDKSEVETLYWSLPEQFLGNKLNSYQGNLTVTQRFYGEGSDDTGHADVILIGNDLTLYWQAPQGLEPDKTSVYSVPLMETSDWQKVQGGYREPASREDFLSVLSKLDYILVKATRAEQMKETFLKKIMLDIAVSLDTGFAARGVEECQCPQGYKGFSCEDCERGFYRDIYDRSGCDLGNCKPCDCNGNEKSCSLDKSRRLICECRDGFEGDRCESRIGPQPLPEVPIIVTVTEPKIKIVQIGETVTFTCNARSVNQNSPLSITWSKENGQLPAASYLDSARGMLIITGIRSSDSGTYVCTASDGFYIYTDKAILNIEEQTSGGTETTWGLIQIDPLNYDATAGDEVRISCYYPASGFTLTWKRQNDRLPQQAYQQDGTLIIPDIREANAGVYECIARNAQGQTVNAETRITVRPRYQPPPNVKIEPEQITLAQGREGRLLCLVDGQPPPKVEWSKVGEELRNNRNIYVQGTTLILNNVQVSDRGVYVCTAENAGGASRASAIVEVERREVPVIDFYPESRQTVTKGGSVLFQCRAVAGIPSPKLTWRRLDGRSFGSNVEILDGGVIRINQVEIYDKGQYECRAVNDAGTTSGILTLNVLESPSIVMEPSGSVQLNVGEELRLVCTARGDPTPTVVWEKIGQYSQTQSLSTKKTSAVHLVRQLTKDDEGTYLCRASNDAGEVEDVVQVIVIESEAALYPEIELTNPGYGQGSGPGYEVETGGYDQSSTGQGNLQVERSTFEAPIGGNVELRCFVVGTAGRISALWKRTDGSSLPSNSYQTEGVLTIPSVKTQDGGQYTCQGLDSRNVVIFEATTNLIIIVPPRVILNPTQQVVRPGEDAFITCQVTGDEPISKTWAKSGSNSLPRSVKNNNGVLEFKQISVSDQGRYICSASNPAGTSEAVAEVVVNDDYADFTLTEKFSSRPGASVELFCRLSNAANVGSLAWRRETGPVPSKAKLMPGGRLRIPDVAIEDGGRYICSQGGRTQYVQLLVENLEENALLKFSEKISITQSNLENTFFGDDFELSCQVQTSSLSGQYRITWQKDSGYMGSNVQSSGGTLRFQQLRPENEGLYRCLVETRLGTASKEFVLKVPNLSADEKAVEEKHVSLGSRVELNCRTSIGVPVTFHWQKLQGVISRDVSVQGASLIIDSAEPQHAGTYICTANNSVTEVEMTTLLTVSGLVPYFSQAPVSYIALDTLPDAYLAFDVEVSFRPESPDGLILFNGQNEQGSGDFVSLLLRDGVPEFRFNVGSETAIITGKKPLKMGKWHQIKIQRSRKDGSMIVNNGPAIQGSVSGRFQGLDLLTPLYLGSVPNVGALPKTVGTRRGFVGCISQVIVGSRQLDIAPSHHPVSSQGITECETCASQPCDNGGICQEANSPNGYTCLCQTGFSGSECKKIGDACFPGACGSGRCANTASGYECFCPFGKAGQNCEKDISISKPYFSEESYIGFPRPKHILRALKLSFKFNAEDAKDAILMYCAQSQEGQGDFASFTIKDEYAEFRFDTGSGPIILKSKNKVIPGKWYTVDITRKLREGELKLSGEATIVGSSPGSTRGLNIRTPMYFGGINRDQYTVASGVGVDGGFTGCISDVVIGNSLIDAAKSLVDSSNIEDCSIRYTKSPCEDNPCENGGSCSPNGPDDFKCYCDKEFVGLTCTDRVDICDLEQPCGQGATCLTTTSKPYYRCLCPWNEGGPQCKETFVIGKAIGFNGDGYAELNGNTSFSKTPGAISIKMVLNTEASESLVVWHGNLSGNKKDFLAIAINDRYPTVTFNLGSGANAVVGDTRISDGLDHLIEVQLQGRSASIKVDQGKMVTQEGKGTQTHLDNLGTWSIGGVRDMEIETGGWFQKRFSGCIKSFTFQKKRINFQRDAIKTANLVPCQGKINSDDYMDEDILDETMDNFDEDQYLERGNRG